MTASVWVKPRNRERADATGTQIMRHVVREAARGVHRQVVEAMPSAHALVGGLVAGQHEEAPPLDQERRGVPSRDEVAAHPAVDKHVAPVPERERPEGARLEREVVARDSVNDEQVGPVLLVSNPLKERGDGPVVGVVDRDGYPASAARTHLLGGAPTFPGRADL